MDPNGEYASAFSDLGSKLRLFRVPPVSSGEQPLDVPAWLWSGHEWSAVAHAQPGAQRPLLLQGIRELKSGTSEKAPRAAVISRYLYSYSIRINSLLKTGVSAFSGSVRARFDCAGALTTIIEDCATFSVDQSLTEEQQAMVQRVRTAADTVIASRKSGEYFRDFTITDLETILSSVHEAIEALPEFESTVGISEDSPDYLTFDFFRTI